MKQKQWFTVVITLLVALALSLSVFATGGQGSGTGEGPMDGLESILDTLESDLLPGDPEDGTVTGDGSATAPQSDAPTDTADGATTTTGGADDDGGSAVGLVIGIGIAVIVLILVFVILARNNGTKEQK